MSESIYFIVFPYIAIIFAFGAGIYRYFTNRFSYSSMSSQFLENRALFWGSVPWHYSIVLILLAHLQAAVLPGLWVSLHVNPYSMFVLGLIALTLGALAVIGLIILILRRIVDPKARVITTVMDWILLADLLLQITAGLYISLFYRWGSLWYVYTATPWLASLATLSPRIDLVTPLPWIVRFHMVNAFVVIGLFPFTRLVHIFTVPLSYLWRPYQVTIWNNDHAKGKDEMNIETKGSNREVG